jgi:hypothetical protein
MGHVELPQLSEILTIGNAAKAEEVRKKEERGCAAANNPN